MFTKEELMQKGHSPEEADQIIRAMSSGNSDPFDDLRKALDFEDLAKANDGDGDDDDKGKGKDDDDDDEQPDEEYMRKYLRKYMSKNKEECMKAAEDVGLFDKKMQKAVDNFNMEGQAAIIEMDDLAPLMKANVEAISSIAKSMDVLARNIEQSRGIGSETFELLTKASRAILSNAVTIEKMSGQPIGRKGQVSISADQQMIKGRDLTALAPLSQNDSEHAYRVMHKAMLSGDRKSGDILSKYESSGRNPSVFTKEDREYIAGLLQQK